MGMGTFVSVGNAHQPFARLLDAVAACAGALPKPVVVQHGHTPFTVAGCQAEAFLPMDAFAVAVERADLLILHAGTGSVLHALAAGRVPVLMARRAHYGEIVDDHQWALAERLAAEGRAIHLRDPAALPEAAGDALRMQAAGPRGDAAEPPMVATLRRLLARYERVLTERVLTPAPSADS